MINWGSECKVDQSDILVISAESWPDILNHDGTGSRSLSSLQLVKTSALLKKRRGWQWFDWQSCLMSCPGCTHHRIDSGVHAQRCVLRGERFAGRDDEVRVAGARSPLCDVLQRWMAAQCCVVWAACRQEVRCLVSCHYLPCIGKDGGGKEAKRIHTWE